MKITEATLYGDFEPIEKHISTAAVEEIKIAAERYYGRCYELTIDEFFALLDCDFSRLGDLREPTVLQIYWIKRFQEDFLPAMQRAGERYTIPPTGRETEARNGTYDLSMQEGMLVFLRDFFGLHTFADAGKITLAEYILARKYKYNCDLMQRNYDRISLRELKHKK